MSVKMAERTAIGVVGAARMGIALAHQMAHQGHEVILFTTLPERAQALSAGGSLPEIIPELTSFTHRAEVTTDPAYFARRTTIVFMTTSDYLLTRILAVLGDHLDGAHILVHATHSLYGESLTRASELVEAYTCVKQIGALAGPLHVSELLAGSPNVALVGSEFPEVIVRTQAALETPNFHIYGSNDIRGVEYAAALHQVVALATGLAAGAELGSATHSALVAAGLQEIARVGVACGASRESFYGVVGVGRLVDALARGEANYDLGIALARSSSPEATLQAAPIEAKGPEIVDLLLTWAEANGMSLPFTEAVQRVLRGEQTADAACREVMNRSDLFAQAVG